MRLPSWLFPKLDWLQVEISSCCNAACIYCPHTLYQDSWQSRLMSIEAFQMLAPILAKTRLVYLQGWGEPFFHHQFFDFVSYCKSAGCRVGATTNGMLLDEEKCLRLVQEDLDVIAFTLAGVDTQNDRIRQGTCLDQVLQAIQSINRIKQQSGSAHPDIHIAYMLLRSQLDSLQQLPALLGGLNINQVVISTLDFVGHPSLVEEALVPQNEQEFGALCSQLNSAVKAGSQSGLNIRYWLAEPPSDTSEPPLPVSGHELAWPYLLTQPDSCTENILRSAFISSDGEVSPCVYMNIPVNGATFIESGHEMPYHRITFGNGQTRPFGAIWRSKRYTSFRNRHQQYTLPPYCRTCVRHRMVGT